MSEARAGLSTSEILALAESTPTTDIPTAAAVLGIGANLGYQLAAAGTFPVRVLRFGRKLRVPTADLLALLGLPPAAGMDAPANETDAIYPETCSGGGG